MGEPGVGGGGWGNPPANCIRIVLSVKHKDDSVSKG